MGQFIAICKRAFNLECGDGAVVAVQGWYRLASSSHVTTIRVGALASAPALESPRWQRRDTHTPVAIGLLGHNGPT